jgi:hypothetical protein
MEQQAKQMITDLFGKLKQAEYQTGPRDADAEGLINKAVAAQPSAPYYMAQAILVQEHALNNLNQRVQQLEQELIKPPAGGGGFLSGLFGAGVGADNSSRARRPVPAANPGPFQNARQGGFLSSALQTAAGVAGGVLLANAVMGMFDGNPVEAATTEAEPAPTEAAPAEETTTDTQDHNDPWGEDFDSMDDEQF